MNDFIEKAEQIQRSATKTNFKEDFELVFRARQKLQRAFVKSNIDLDNIEELFAAFETASLLDRLADMTHDEVVRLPLAMRRVITETLDQNIEYSIRSDGFLHAPNIYRAFVTLLQYLASLEKWPITLLSFNYDLALDFALIKEKFSIDYGLDPATTHVPGGIELLKLHGSLNWYRAETSIVSARLNPEVQAVSLEGKAVMRCRTKDLLDNSLQLPELTDPVIVPPTWNKGQHHSELAAVWRRAALRLAEAENIVVIGYSAPPTDKFYRHLFAIGTISDTILRRYICIGPNVGQNHKALMGGAGSSRGVLTEIGSTFSQALPVLCEKMGLDTAGRGLFGDGRGIATLVGQVARGEV